MSVLSADELQGTQSQAQQHEQPQQAQLPVPAAQHSSHSSQDVLHTSSSGRHQRHEFLVTAAQLRGMVQAAVDSSQAAAADEIIAEVAAKVLQAKQQRQERRAAKHAAAAAATAEQQGVDRVSSNGAEPAQTGSSSSKQQQMLPLAPMLAAALGTDLQRGLSGGAADAAARRAAFGSNSLAVSATSSFWQLLLEAASDSTLLLLTAAGAVSLALAAGTGKEAADFIDGAAILASVAICAGVTAVTNYQKEEKFRQLNRLKEDVPVRGAEGRGEVGGVTAASSSNSLSSGRWAGSYAVLYFSGVTLLHCVFYYRQKKLCCARTASCCGAHCLFCWRCRGVQVRVMRGGAELTLSCWDLLVGDLLLVEAGDILPADGLLVAGGSLK